jgi:hypothetical protein
LNFLRHVLCYHYGCLSYISIFFLYLFQIPTDPYTGKTTSHTPQDIERIISVIECAIIIEAALLLCFTTPSAVVREALHCQNFHINPLSLHTVIVKRSINSENAGYPVPELIHLFQNILKIKVCTKIYFAISSICL